MKRLGTVSVAMQLIFSESARDNTCKMTCVPTEDTNHSEYPPSLIVEVLLPASRNSSPKL